MKKDDKETLNEMIEKIENRLGRELTAEEYCKIGEYVSAEALARFERN